MTQNLNEESKKYMEQFADETLAKLQGIADKAKDKLREGGMRGADVLASINTMNSSSTVQKLDQISQENQESYKKLAQEPAIARVLVTDEEGEEQTYYICRALPLSGFPNLASYHAPIGRLASLAVGTEFKLPNGAIVEVLERAHLHPSDLAEGWDSLDTVVETEKFGLHTIKSLRTLLQETVGEDAAEDILSALLAEETDKANIIEGVRRSVITKMGLRDQPILDQYQDEIFRLPLNKRLLILGPPGTGKTTTLIRRLGQKLDTDFLDEGEQRLIETITSTEGSTHASSWLMFTPTELLKQYLKEAFAREDVPASDLRIRTWQDYRRELARNTFGVLKTASGGGTFVLKEGLQSLKKAALDNPIQWFDDFNAWQKKAYTQELHNAVKDLESTEHPEAQHLGEQLQEILFQAENSSMASLFSALVTEIANVQTLVAGLKEGSDAKIKETLNLQLNRNRTFLDELARVIDNLQTQVADVDD